MQRLPNPNVALNSPDLAWTSCHEDDCKWQEATLAFQNAVVQVLWACGFCQNQLLATKAVSQYQERRNLTNPLLATPRAWQRSAWRICAAAMCAHADGATDHPEWMIHLIMMKKAMS